MTATANGNNHHPEHVLVVGPDGRPLHTMAEPSSPTDGNGVDTDHNASSDLSDLVAEPAKIMRIGTMIKQLLDEVRTAPLDEAARSRLRDIHSRSIRELEGGLSSDLRAELERITLPFSDDATPSDAELRIAQAQLVGWLEGVFHGIQTALFAQQMAARAQLEEMRRQAIQNAAPHPHHPETHPNGGQYL